MFHISNVAVVSVGLDRRQYSVMEGSNVSVKILADKPVLTVYSVLLEAILLESSFRASGIQLSMYSCVTYSCTPCIADDFVMESVELQFAPDQTEISFSMHTLSDLLLEADETFMVRINISNSSKMIGVKLSESSVSSATITIISTNGNSCISITCMHYYYMFYRGPCGTNGC